MLYRSRLVGSFAAALLALAVPSFANAQQAPPGANPQAEALNEQGKDLYKNKDFQGAAAKFREANSIQPDGRYYFNLCATLEKAGDLDGALEACDSVYQYAPPDELKAKTGQRAASIRQSIRARNGQGGEQPGGTPGGTPPGGDTTANPGGQPGNPPGGAVAPGPQPEVTKVVNPDDYKWAFGAELGAIVDSDLIPGTNAGGLLRLYADRSVGRLGGRAFLGLGATTGNDNAFNADETMSIVEFGVAGFTNVKLGKNLWITPMVGVELAGLQPSISGGGSTASGDSIGTFGLNLGLPITYTFGGGKHALYVNPLAFTYYLPTSGDSVDFNGMPGGSFDGAYTFMISVGYQLRLQEGEKIPGFVILE